MYCALSFSKLTAIDRSHRPLQKPQPHTTDIRLKTLRGTQRETLGNNKAARDVSNNMHVNQFHS
jgi:hypothetical protein